MARLLLDTNQLVLWIVGNLDSKRLRGRRLEPFGAGELKRLNEIVRPFRGHVSTPNTRTEASNLIGAGQQQLCAGACDKLGDYIRSRDEI